MALEWKEWTHVVLAPQTSYWRHCYKLPVATSPNGSQSFFVFLHGRANRSRACLLMTHCLGVNVNIKLLWKPNSSRDVCERIRGCNKQRFGSFLCLPG